MPLQPVLIVDNSINRFVLREGPLIEDQLGGHPVKIVQKKYPLPDPSDFCGIIISGSEVSVLDEFGWIHRQIEFIHKATQAEVPILGICFGHQLLARAIAGKDAVRRSATPEFGWKNIRVIADDPLLDGMKLQFKSFCSHFDEVCNLPEDFRVLAQSDKCTIQAFAYKLAPVWGIQFHPEIDPITGLLMLGFYSKILRRMNIDLRAIYKEIGDDYVGRRLMFNFTRCKH